VASDGSPPVRGPNPDRATGLKPHVIFDYLGHLYKTPSVESHPWILDPIHPFRREHWYLPPMVTTIRRRHASFHDRILRKAYIRRKYERDIHIPPGQGYRMQGSTSDVNMGISTKALSGNMTCGSLVSSERWTVLYTRLSLLQAKPK
jgi:hypothetical protein